MTDDLYGEAPKQVFKRGGKYQPNGYAATPGTGPADETCRTCQHCIRITRNIYRSCYKCAVIRVHWTNSYGTDILMNSPACRHWKEKVR